jgi:hypothetical protein
MNIARTGLSGAGTSNTSAIAFGGATSGLNVGCTESYNGTTWSICSGLIYARLYLAGAGTGTGALAFGGITTLNPSSNLTEGYACATYGPYIWTSGNSMITSRQNLAGAGCACSAIAFGGNSPSTSGATETYNGMSWTSAASLITPRAYLSGAGTSNTSAIAFGGATPSTVGCTEKFNGTSWVTSCSLINARINAGGAGTNPSAITFGGQQGPNTISCTEAIIEGFFTVTP